MNLLAKVLIGTAVVAGASAVVAVIASKEEEKKVVKVENGNVVQMPTKQEKEPLLDRIKKYVRKKIIKFLAFVALHSEQIEAASTVIGLGSGVIAIAGAIRDFKNGNDTQEKLDEINTKLDTLYFMDVIQNQVTNHNNEVFGAALDHICVATKVDAEALRADLKSIDDEDKEKFREFRRRA